MTPTPFITHHVVPLFLTKNSTRFVSFAGLVESFLSYYPLLDPSKIVFGISSYAKISQLNHGNTPNPDGLYDYSAVPEFVQWDPTLVYLNTNPLKPNWTISWDDQAKMPYSTTQYVYTGGYYYTGPYFYSFDNALSSKYKADYAKNQIIGGIHIYEFGYHAVRFLFFLFLLLPLHIYCLIFFFDHFFSSLAKHLDLILL